METPNGPSPSIGPADVDTRGRLVYVVSQDGPTRADNEMDLFRLWATLWRSRWLIVSVAAAFAVGAGIYAQFLPPMYSATVVLAPVRDESLGGLAGQLGGLASLAGIARVGRDNTDAVAVLRSRDFVRAFIEEQMLLPVLFPELWDAAAGRWKVEVPPDPAQGAGFFVAEVRQIEEDGPTGIVSLTVEWHDPELAASWANQLAVRLNNHMRQRALSEAEANVEYLRHQFESTSVVALQQSISELLESEMQKLMLARGNSEYAYRIIDRAEVPRAKSAPRVNLIVAVAAFFGAMLSAFVALVRDMAENRRSSMSAVSDGSVVR